MRNWGERGSFVAAVVAATLVSGTFLAGLPLTAGAASETVGYAFFWQADIAGYGSYRSWAADIDGDGQKELIVEVSGGESEGMGSAPGRFAVYDRFTKVLGGEAPDGGIASVLDVDDDGQAEFLTLKEEAYDWVAEPPGLAQSEALSAALAGWLKANYFPAPREGDRILDVDGDGTLDYISNDGTSLQLASKTRGSAVISLDPSLGEVSYAGHLNVVRLGRKERALFVETVTYGSTGGTEEGGQESPYATSIHWSLWRGSPAGGYSLFAGLPDPKRPGNEYTAQPEPFFADLDGDGYDEFVTSEAGKILIHRWSDDGYVPELESVDNGGLGYASFMAADMNGNGVPELVARHVTPTVYHHDLKIYEVRNGGLDGLADIKDIGAFGDGYEVVADFLGLGVDQIIMGRDFELCRPNALGLNLDLENLPAPGGSGWLDRAKGWLRAGVAWLEGVHSGSAAGRLALDAAVGVAVAVALVAIARGFAGGKKRRGKGGSRRA